METASTTQTNTPKTYAYPKTHEELSTRSAIDSSSTQNLSRNFNKKNIATAKIILGQANNQKEQGTAAKEHKDTFKVLVPLQGKNDIHRPMPRTQKPSQLDYRGPSYTETCRSLSYPESCTPLEQLSQSVPLSSVSLPETELSVRQKKPAPKRKIVFEISCEYFIMSRNKDKVHIAISTLLDNQPYPSIQSPSIPDTYVIKYIKEKKLLEQAILIGINPKDIEDRVLGCYTDDSKLKIIGLTVYHNLFTECDLREIILRLTPKYIPTRIILSALDQCDGQTFLSLALSKKTPTVLQDYVIATLQANQSPSLYPKDLQLKNYKEDYISIALKNNFLYLIKSLCNFGAQITHIGTLLSFDTGYIVGPTEASDLIELIHKLPPQSIKDLGSIDKFIEITFVQYGFCTPPNLSIAIIKKMKDINELFPKTKLNIKHLKDGHQLDSEFIDDGFTLLHLSALYDLPELTAFLIQNNADGSIASKIKNYTPLNYAQYADSYRNMILLLWPQEETNMPAKKDISAKKNLNSSYNSGIMSLCNHVLHEFAIPLQEHQNKHFAQKALLFCSKDEAAATQKIMAQMEKSPQDIISKNVELNFSALQLMIIRGCPFKIILRILVQTVGNCSETDDKGNSILMLALEKASETQWFAEPADTTGKITASGRTSSFWEMVSFWKKEATTQKKKLALGCVFTSLSQYVNNAMEVLNTIIDLRSTLISKPNSHGETPLYLAIRKRLPNQFIIEKLLLSSDPFQETYVNIYQGIRIPNSLSLLIALDNLDLFKDMLKRHSVVEKISIDIIQMLFVLSILWKRQNFFDELLSNQFLNKNLSKTFDTDSTQSKNSSLDNPLGNSPPGENPSIKSSLSESLAIECSKNLRTLFPKRDAQTLVIEESIAVRLQQALEQYTHLPEALVHTLLLEGDNQSINFILEIYHLLKIESYKELIKKCLVHHPAILSVFLKKIQNKPLNHFPFFIEKNALITLCEHHNHPISAAALLEISDTTYLNQSDCDGNNPLHLTVKKGYKNIFGLIIYHIHNDKTFATWTNKRNNEGMRPLDLAVTAPAINIEMIKNLVPLTGEDHSITLNTLLKRMEQEYLPIPVIYPFLDSNDYTFDTKLESNKETLFLQLLKIKSKATTAVSIQNYTISKESTKLVNSDLYNLFKKINLQDCTPKLFFGDNNSSVTPYSTIIEKENYFSLEILLDITFLKDYSEEEKINFSTQIQGKLPQINASTSLTRKNIRSNFLKVLEKYTGKKIPEKEDLDKSIKKFKQLVHDIVHWNHEDANGTRKMPLLISWSLQQEDLDLYLLVCNTITSSSRDISINLVTYCNRSIAHVSLVAVIINQFTQLQKNPNTPQELLSYFSRITQSNRIGKIIIPPESEIISFFLGNSQSTQPILLSNQESCHKESTITFQNYAFKTTEPKDTSSLLQDEIPKEDSTNSMLKEDISNIVNFINLLKLNLNSLIKPPVSSSESIL